MRRMFFFERGRLRGSLESRPSAWKTQCEKQHAGSSGRPWPLCHFLRLSSCDTDGHEGGSAVLPRGWGAGLASERKGCFLPVLLEQWFPLKITATVPTRVRVSVGPRRGTGRACRVLGTLVAPRGGSAADMSAILQKDVLLSPPRSCVFFSSQSGTTVTNAVRAAGQSRALVQKTPVHGAESAKSATACPQTTAPRAKL